VRLPPIPPGTADRYAATRARLIDPLKTIKALEQRGLLRSQQLSDVCTIIEQHDGQFTEHDLAQFMRTSTKLGDEVINHLSSIIAALEHQTRVGRDYDQKLRRIKNIWMARLTAPPPPRPT
jgi:hypothetical protein